jgi:predicted kinase
MPHGCFALLLTGTCGSGKSTVATLIERQPNWTRVSEDEIWPLRFGRDRGAFGTDEHRAKRAVVQEEVLEHVRTAVAAGHSIVVDATIHESPPEALEDYRRRFDAADIPWRLCVLHPRLEVAIARDAGRPRGSMGADRVASLHRKFTGRVFPRECFLDSSDEAAEATVDRVLHGLHVHLQH